MSKKLNSFDKRHIIILPKFKDNATKWISFGESVKAAVHDNKQQFS